MSNFTKRQWLTLIGICTVDFCNGIVVLLQAPFYPREAESKGLSATEYGIVFGIFELVVFVMSPILGARVYKYGARFMFIAGVLTTSTCAVLFGCLDLVEGHYPFLILSILIRMVEAVGSTSFLTASFSLLANEFPEQIATVFASVETFSGLGFIAGPTVGGILYELGGYKMPFVILGAFLFLSGLIAYNILPADATITDAESDKSLMSILKIPIVAIASLSILVTSIGIGFTQTTLEPHLRQFDLSPFMVGVVFIVSVGTYGATSPIVGRICDKMKKPEYILILGALCYVVAGCLIGPLPFLIQKSTIPVIIVGLFFQGIGNSTQMVPSFVSSIRACFDYGYPNNTQTYGLCAGLWCAVFAFGMFVGPILSGVLYDLMGFRYSMIFIVIIHLIMFIVVTSYLLVRKRRPNYEELTNISLRNNDILIGKNNKVYTDGEETPPHLNGSNYGTVY